MPTDNNDVLRSGAAIRRSAYEDWLLDIINGKSNWWGSTWYIKPQALLEYEVVEAELP